MPDQEQDRKQDHPLHLYNSLSRELERFVPDDASRVTMYGCGPTVYSYAHVGNARAAVVADVLFRVLRHIYGEDCVEYARNLTDVDDKIIAASLQQGKPMSEITDRYARIYNEDLAALNCLAPTHQPRATEHIQDMADLIVTLLDKGAAYEADGHVYFDVTSDADYGKLSGRRLEDNRAGARVEVAGAKRNPGDFVLWKPAKSGEPGWSQQDASGTYAVDWRNHGSKPFATQPGRPGWHIECSAMAKASLGVDTIDVHTGGIDLLFPHHENEIAQSETANGEVFARHWVHNEFLNMGRDKMSKSEGNVVLVHDLLEEWDGEVIRLALLKAHYRNELVWSNALLEESKTQLDRWYRKLDSFSSQLDKNSRALFFRPADDNFLLDLSIGYQIPDADLLFGRVDESEARNEPHARLINRAYNYLAILGLLQRDPKAWLRGNASSEDTAHFDALATARAAARTAKDWAEADRIRDEGKALGIVFEDGPDGTSWRKA